MKIGILIHGLDNVDFAAYVNHCALMASLPKQYEYAFFTIRNTNVCQARNALIDLAIEHKVDKILLLDTDHIFPLDILSKLMEVDADMVSGLICKRRDKFIQVGYVYKDGLFSSVLMPPNSGIYNVDTCAFGCTLIDMSIIHDIKKPYFYDGGERKIRSDLNFCLDAKALNKKIVIHSGVLCGHLVSEPLIVYPYNNLKIKNIIENL